MATLLPQKRVLFHSNGRATFYSPCCSRGGGEIFFSCARRELPAPEEENATDRRGTVRCGIGRRPGYSTVKLPVSRERKKSTAFLGLSHWSLPANVCISEKSAFTRWSECHPEELRNTQVAFSENKASPFALSQCTFRRFASFHAQLKRTAKSRGMFISISRTFQLN